jgi:hypothetical protein
MSDVRDITITLVRGGVERTVTPEALASELGLESVRPALLALLLRPLRPSGEPTEGERSFVPNVNVENILPENVPERSFSTEHEASSKRAHALAEQLARELDDRGSLPWFERVATALDEQVVTDALARALQVPEHMIRRSRAAYFTAIVAPLLRRVPDADRPPHAPRP